LAENGGSPHSAKEEPPPFLARRLPFCPGRGLICHTGNPLSSEPIRNTAFFERIPFFFSTKWEMIQKFLFSQLREQVRLKFPSSADDRTNKEKERVPVINIRQKE
jgi:hypothetical protein